MQVATAAIINTTVVVTVVVVLVVVDGCGKLVVIEIESQAVT